MHFVVALDREKTGRCDAYLNLVMNVMMHASTHHACAYACGGAADTPLRAAEKNAAAAGSASPQFSFCVYPDRPKGDYHVP